MREVFYNFVCLFNSKVRILVLVYKSVSYHAANWLLSCGGEGISSNGPKSRSDGPMSIGQKLESSCEPSSKHRTDSTGTGS